MQCECAWPMFALVENLRQKQLKWIEAVLDQTHWTATDFARRARVHPSTLSKFLNDPENFQQLGGRTVAKLSEISPIPAYETEALANHGFGEASAVQYRVDNSDEDHELKHAVASICAGRNAVHPWVMRSRALENLGYSVGDILIVDLNSQPHDGDIVCLQLFDQRGEAQTIFRVLHRPFLTAATMDHELIKPMLLDDRTLVRGVVIAALKPRRAAA